MIGESQSQRKECRSLFNQGTGQGQVILSNDQTHLSHQSHHAFICENTRTLNKAGEPSFALPVQANTANEPTKKKKTKSPVASEAH